MAKKQNFKELIGNFGKQVGETSAKGLSDLKSSWAWGTVLAADLSKNIAGQDWFKSINDFKSEVSKSMDSDFLSKGMGAVDPETVLSFSANNHRILDGGHTLFESISRAKEIGETNNWTSLETFQEWGKAYFTDLSSSAGMPAFGALSDNVYSILRAAGIDEAVARDLVTVNGQEAVEAILGGTITSLGLVFAWKSQDKEQFSRAVGSILIGSAIAMNPMTLCLAVNYGARQEITEAIQKIAAQGDIYKSLVGAFSF
jgi:hypothetical protein